tara:strand:+ start:210 stop:941 length:732 start_codon:yes stop_codon:yes gene_type:complete
MSIKKYTGTREQWLEKAVKEIYKQLKLKGYTDFIKQASEIKVSFGHMPKGMKNSTIGVCQYTSEDADLDDLDKKGTRHLFIRPTLKANNLEETLDIFQVLAHEVCHAVLPAGEGHKKSFKDLIIGLLKAEGKPTATVRGSEFDKWAKPIVKKLGLVPHIAILEHQKAPKTSIKVACLDECCSAGNERSRKDGFGLVWRVSTSAIKEQKTSQKKLAKIINNEQGVFICPACEGDTIIIAEGDFR